MSKELIIILCFIVFFVTIISLISIITILLKVNKYSSNGLAIYRIDNVKKTIVKISSKTIGGSYNLDFSKKYALETNKYYDLDKFLNLFTKESRDTIINFLNKSSTKEIFSLNVSFDENIIKKEVLGKLMPKLLLKKNLLYWLKIFPSKHLNTFYFTLHWKDDAEDNKKTLKLNTDLDLIKDKLKQKKVIVYAFELSEFALIKGLNKQNYTHLLKLIKQNQDVLHYFKDGIIFLFVPIKQSLKFHLKQKQVNKIFNKIKEKVIFRNLINRYAFLSFTKISENNFVSELLTKAKYLFLHHANWPIWLSNNEKLNIAQYNSFVNLINAYQNKLQYSDFVHENVSINEANNPLAKKDKISFTRASGFTKEDLTQLRALIWNRILATEKVNSFALDNQVPDNKLYLFTNQFDLNKNFAKYNDAKVSLIIKQIDQSFSYKLLHEIISRNKHNNIELGLYVWEIDYELINFIYNSAIKTLIISANITSAIIQNPDNYLKLLNLSKIIEKQNIKMIYENLPTNFPQKYADSLHIKFTYKN